MVLTIILRGFKVTVPVLDRFLAANGQTTTKGYAPIIQNNQLDLISKLLRTKLGGGDSKTRLFFPSKRGHQQPTTAYVAYDWIMVYGKREINLAEELPDKAPPGFAQLRKKMMGPADDGQELQDESLTRLFVIVNDKKELFFMAPELRKSDLCCDECGEMFLDWLKKQDHRLKVYGADTGLIPDNF